MARRVLSTALLLGLSTILPDSASGQEQGAAGTSLLTLDRLYSLPNLIGTAPSGFAWSRDGRMLAFLWNDEGGNFRDVWVLDATDPQATPSRATTMAPEPSAPEAGADALTEARTRLRAEADRGIGAVQWHPDGRRLLLSYRGDFWLGEPGGAFSPVTETPAAERHPRYSPDGSTLAFLRQGDLWLMPADGSGSSPRRWTRVATEGVNVTGFEWSFDGSHIALLETDARNVAIRGIPDYLAEETRMAEVRRAYPGESPAAQRIGVVEARLGSPGTHPIAWVALFEGPLGGGAPDLLLGYHWSPGESRLAIDTSDLFAKDRRIFVVDVDPGGRLSVHLAVHEQEPLNETFYFWRVAWSSSGERLYYLSDRNQDYHVWSVDPDRTQDDPRQLTHGAWAVASMHPVDGGLVVVGNRGNPEERQLFRVDASGGEPVQVSRRPGTHAPVLSPDGLFAAVAFSSDQSPPELLLTALDPGGPETLVTHSPVQEFEEYDWVEPRYVTFRSHVDGTTLHGRLTLPPDFDPSHTYPAILGSVYTDAVRNQWGGRTAHPTWGLDQYLAQEGYVLLNVDMRGSWGRGRDHRRGIRLDYGGMDIEDLESGVRFLEAEGYVDMDRVGIWGSSYGGLMTAMSLFRKPGLYAAGVAGAPATNVWHALTGQMAVMLGPDDSPAEYADSSPFLHAEGLEAPLMIIHGMRDRVVLFKDSLILVQRLILLGKDVDLVALPDAGHGWDNENLAQTRFTFHKLVDFFNLHLKGPKP